MIGVAGRWRTLALLAVVMVVIAGCASSSSGRMKTTQSSMDEALQDHIQLGLSYIGQGNRDAARHHLNRALDMDARSAGVHNGLALLYQMEQEEALAEKHFKRAIALDSQFTRARNNYGVYLFQQQRIDEAYRQFQTVTRDTSYPYRPQAFLSLGVTANRLGHEAAAFDAWNRAIALEPRLAQPYLELAAHHFEAEDYPLARRLLAAHEELARPSARSLWLGLRLEQRFGSADGVASKGLALSKLFPYSQENLEYQEWLKSEQ